MIPAVAYYRMSSDKQEMSIPDQRREVEELAKRDGYSIIREYTEPGISGDDTEKRKQFLKLRQDAEQKQDFGVILCWDQDRFGRFDMMDAGYWIKPLRNAGVRLVTIAQGTIDWNDFAGRMVFGIQQEGKHQFLRDLSRNVTRSFRRIAKEGKIVNGRCPYGFDKVYLDESGDVVAHMRRTERAVPKRPEWDIRLVVSNDPVAVQTVKWIFKTYDENDISQSAIAEQLNERGTPTPREGRLWRQATINSILKNPAYAGDAVYGRFGSGKYYRAAEEGVVKAPLKKTYQPKPAEQCIVVRDTHEPLVGRDVFDRVQQKMHGRRERRSPRKRFGDRFVLSGLLYCGSCEKRMSARWVDRGPTGSFGRYFCCTYMHIGRRSGCQCWSVGQRAIVDLLIRKLTEIVESRVNSGKLRKAIIERLKTRRQDNSDVLPQIQKRIKTLESDIDIAVEKALRLGDELADLTAAKIGSWRRELTQLTEQKRKLERLSHRGDVEADADGAVGKLLSMQQELQTADNPRLRELLRRFVSRVTFWWEPETRQKVNLKYRIARGEIRFAADCSGLNLESNPLGTSGNPSLQSASADSPFATGFSRWMPGEIHPARRLQPGFSTRLQTLPERKAG